MKKVLKVGTIQMTCGNNQHENQLKIEKQIKELANENLDLVVLQELHDSIYFCQTEDIQQFNLAQKLPGQAAQFYAQLAKHSTILATKRSAVTATSV